MLLHLLTIVFITLKLTGFIAWTWPLVLLPSIIGIVIPLLLMMIVGILTVITYERYNHGY